MEQKKYNFDQVSILMAGGGYNLLNKEDFLGKPLAERIQLISSGRVQFIRDGQIISLKEAFKLNE